MFQRFQAIKRLPEVRAIRDGRVVIRVPMDQIRVLGRATQGVKVMATGEAKIASIATFATTRPSQAPV